MDANGARPRGRREAGFTMVEVLVALVLLAIGLLGIAALYLDSLRAGRTAIFRTQAVTLAADLADRIRANRAATASYAINYGVQTAQVPNCFTTAGCSPANLAATDLQRWKADIANQLPNGDGQVIVTPPALAGNPTTYQITIVWDEVGEPAPVQFQIGFAT